jgi:hypothetical protein
LRNGNGEGTIKPVPGARIVLAVARGAFITFAASAALVACGLTLVAVCAAVGVLLYGLAHLFAFGFGIEFRWGLVIACWLLLVVPPVWALTHDLRMHRRLAVLEKSPTPKQRPAHSRARALRSLGADFSDS